MADTRTTETFDDVVAFIAAIEDEPKRKDAQTLVRLMEKVTGERPKLWGTIVGFGQYHYKYDSGHEGDTCYVGFAPRKAEFSIYLTGTYFPEQGDTRERLLKRLGKHRIGKACLYVKRLEDIDLGALEELVEMSVSALKRHYPPAKP